MFQIPPLSLEIVEAGPIVLFLALPPPLCGGDLSPVTTKWRDMAEMEHNHCDRWAAGGQGGYLNSREEELSPSSLSKKAIHHGLLGWEPCRSGGPAPWGPNLGCTPSQPIYVPSSQVTGSGPPGEGPPGKETRVFSCRGEPHLRAAWLSGPRPQLISSQSQSSAGGPVSPGQAQSHLIQSWRNPEGKEGKKG